MPSGHLAKVDFLSGQETFHSHLPDGQAGDQASGLSTNPLKEITKTFQEQTKFESYLSQGQAGIQVFFKSWLCMSPGLISNILLPQINSEVKMCMQNKQNKIITSKVIKQ